MACHYTKNFQIGVCVTIWMTQSHIRMIRQQKVHHERLEVKSFESSWLSLLGRGSNTCEFMCTLAPYLQWDSQRKQYIPFGFFCGFYFDMILFSGQLPYSWLFNCCSHQIRVLIILLNIKMKLISVHLYNDLILFCTFIRCLLKYYYRRWCWKWWKSYSWVLGNP